MYNGGDVHVPKAPHCKKKMGEKKKVSYFCNVYIVKIMQVEKCCWKRSESVELYGKVFIPDGSMNALVIIVHGIGQHSGCYDEWAEKFALQSIGVLTFDLRGHGRSPGIRGHTSLNIIKDDLRAIIDGARRKFPNVPIVLFGHSMGGLIVLSMAVDKNAGVQGFIASSPWLKLVRPPSTLLIKLAKWASHIAPWLTVRTGIRANQLSQDSATARSSKKDPLLHKKISVKLFSDLLAGSEMLLRNKHELNTPLLMMHGTADPLVSFKASKSFARKNKQMITFLTWRKMRHDLLNDTGKEMVFRHIMRWLSKHITPKWNYSEQS